MSHRNTNIENYLYYADSEALAGSNDDNKIVMFPTSAVLVIAPNSKAGTYRTSYRRQDGSHAADTALCSHRLPNPTVDEWVNGLNILVANMQKDSMKGMVSIADTANNTSCNQEISSAAGSVTLTTAAL
tara:strand:- start:865 stop:1251 length:387 start_codon:yes stop_codon:yes gene_type:complete